MILKKLSKMVRNKIEICQKKKNHPEQKNSVTVVSKVGIINPHNFTKKHRS